MGIKNKNRVIAAAAKLSRDIDEDELPPMKQDADEGFDPTEPEGFTDEDAAAEVSEMSASQSEALNRSRKRGRSAHDDRKGHRTSEARGQREHRENEFVYRPLNSLDAPPPRPGMEQRWIRIQLGDKTDVRNWSKQSRYKWMPRALETVSKDFNPPTQSISGIGDVIVVGDLMLCERDVRIGRARRKYMHEQHLRQMAATKRHVKKVERDDHPIRVVDKEDMPPTVGRGRRVRAQEDE